MVLVEELHDPEAALVDVEVDVSPLEIGRMRLPGDRLRVPLLNGAPGLQSNAFAMLADLEEKQVQRIVV